MDDPDVADTVVRQRPPDGRVPRPSGTDDHSDDSDDTRLRVPRPLERSVEREPAASTSAPAAGGPGRSAATVGGSGHVATVLPQVVTPAARAAYRLSVNGGPPVTLDATTLVGRRPAAPRVPDAAPPRLIAVPSPRQEVSGTHVAVRQQGSSVVITDLRSTNGTTVTMPGADAVRLRSGDSLVAGPGAIIDLGDGNVIEILPARRVSAPHDADGRGDR